MGLQNSPANKRAVAISLDELSFHWLFKTIVDGNELEELARTYGDLDIRWARYEFNEPYFRQWQKKMDDSHERRGEVVLVLQNEQGEVLLHSKSFYPDNSYRLPTGGIKYGESVRDALVRETFEETGMKMISERLFATLLYEFRHREQVVPFVSYIFQVTPDHCKPQTQDDRERISGFTWIAAAELESVAAHLKSLSQDWKEWGEFRALAHEIAAEKLMP